MSEHPGFSAGHSAEPVFGAAWMASHPFEFPHRPPTQGAIEMAEDRVQR